VSVSAPPPAAPAAPPPGGGTGTWSAQLHPRGRGGKWIVSHGAGYGPAGADQTTQQLQQRLKQLGFNVPADGKYGPLTQQAVKAFQNRYGLTPSGSVDAATMEVLQNPPSQTLKQVQTGMAATKKAASTAARKTATAKARAKSSQRTARIRAGSGSPTRALNSTVQGPGHLGQGNLQQGAGLTGTASPAVSNLQATLTAAGYKVNKDGRFGPQTEAAVRQLQQAHGLAVDGVVGPETKGLLIGLAASTAKTTTRAKRSARITSKSIPGQPAVLRTAAGTPRHGSRSAGSRMKLTPPKKGPGILKYSAEVPTEQPGLEETTVAFGYGGQPSMSIKDARDQEPAYDQPVWTRTSVQTDIPDLTIQDGREPSPPTPKQGEILVDGREPSPPTLPGQMLVDGREPPPPQPTGDLTIPDGRVHVQTMTRLAEAVLARRAAKTGDEFVRARARERVLRQQLAEAGLYKEALHPRGRGGKWMQAQRDRVAPYFDLTKPHEMVPVDALRPTKEDPESSYRNAAKRMDDAARGGLAKRKPVTAQRGAGGRLLLVDGHATVEALKRKGITHVPAEIRPRATPLNPKTTHEAIREQERLERAAIEQESKRRRAR
jgi:peptidoglycan hydrolase-like protein with peptidoglycan-binding domain